MLSPNVIARQVPPAETTSGNGRQGRIATDYLVAALDRPWFKSGARCPLPVARVRARYIEALGAAGRGNIAPLAAFART